MLAAGHPECRYVATVCASYAVEMMNKVRRALTIGGPTFIHSLDPCPKGWDYDPMLSHELGELAIETGIFPLYEVEDGVVRHYGKTRPRRGPPRKPGASTCSSRGALPTSSKRTSTFPGQGRRDVDQVGDPRRDPVLKEKAGKYRWRARRGRPQIGPGPRL